MFQFGAVIILIMSLSDLAMAHPGHGMDGVGHSHGGLLTAAVITVSVILGSLWYKSRRRSTSS